jgi:hypothetical protein
MNSISSFDESRNTAARTAGVTLLLTMAIVVVANYGISFRLVNHDDTVATALNILGRETPIASTLPAMCSTH